MNFGNLKNWQVEWQRIGLPECCRSKELTYREALEMMLAEGGIAIVQVRGFRRGRRVNNPVVPYVVAQMGQIFKDEDQVRDEDWMQYMRAAALRLEAEGLLNL